MNIEVVLSPLLFPTRQLCDNHTTIAVDVLRATTAICAAFQAGAEEVVPLDSLDPLPDYYRRGYTAAAERGGKKVAVEGIPAMCGNSPTEYLTMDLHGHRLAYSTTNGTVSILTAAQSQRLLVGSFANLSALTAEIIKSNPSNLVILCSGWKGDPCVEDTLFAGALCQNLLQQTNATLVNDAAIYAVRLYQMAAPNLYAFCSSATHVHRLQQMNYDHDIRFAFQLDTCPVVPQLVDHHRLILAS